MSVPQFYNTEMGFSRGLHLTDNRLEL